METAKRNGNKSFISHFLAIGTGTIIRMALGFLTTPIITRIVDPNEYGQFSIFQMYSNIAVMVLCLGLDQSLVRFFYDEDKMEYKQSLLKYCFWLPVMIASAVSVVVWILAYSGLVKFEFSPLVMVMLTLHVIVWIASRVSTLVLRVTMQSKKYSVCNIMEKAVYIVVALALIFVLKDHYFLCLAIASTVAGASMSLFTFLCSREYWKPNNGYELPNKKEVLRYGVPLILAMGITTVFQAIDKMSLNHYCTYAEVGVYSSAMTLVAIFAIIQSTFNSLWGPMQVEHYVKHPEDTSYNQRANRMITFIMFFLGISLILCKDVFALLLGEKYREAGYIMPFLIFNPIMYTISETTCPGIGISKKSYLNIIVAIGACVTNIIGNTLMVPTLGCKGAAISTGISYFVFWALRTILSNRYYYVDYGIPKFLFVTALTSAYAFYNTFFEFGWISVASYIALAGVLIFMYRSTLTDILNMVKRFLNVKVKGQS